MSESISVSKRVSEHEYENECACASEVCVCN